MKLTSCKRLELQRNSCAMQERVKGHLVEVQLDRVLPPGVKSCEGGAGGAEKEGHGHVLCQTQPPIQIRVKRSEHRLECFISQVEACNTSQVRVNCPEIGSGSFISQIEACTSIQGGIYCPKRCLYASPANLKPAKPFRAGSITLKTALQASWASVCVPVSCASHWTTGAWTVAYGHRTLQ